MFNVYTSVYNTTTIRPTGDGFDLPCHLRELVANLISYVWYAFRSMHVSGILSWNFKFFHTSHPVSGSLFFQIIFQTSEMKKKECLYSMYSLPTYKTYEYKYKM